MSETLMNIRYVDASGSHEAQVSRLDDFVRKHPDVTQLILPDGLVELNRYSSLRYRGNENLESIVLPDTLRVLPHDFGEGCNSLKSITFPNGMESIPAGCCYGCDSLESVVLPESIKKIGAGAFSGCQNLESVVLPKSLREIGAGAFSGCQNLENVEFQGCPDVIERNAFRGDKKLMAPEWTNPSNTHPGAFDFTKGKSRECAVEYADGSKGTLSISDTHSLSGVTHISLPEGMTRVDENMFMDTESLVSVTLPDSMQFLEPRVLNCESSLCAVYFNENHPPKFVTDEDEIICIDRMVIYDCYGYGYETYGGDYTPFANHDIMDDLSAGKSTTKAQFDERVSNLSVSHGIQEILGAEDDIDKYNFFRFSLMRPLLNETVNEPAVTHFENILNVRQAGFLSGALFDFKCGYGQDYEGFDSRSHVSHQIESDENSMYNLNLHNGKRVSAYSLRFNQDGSLNVDDCYIEEYGPFKHKPVTYPDKLDTVFRAMKPDVHHPSFRTTLLDIGWPEDIVDSLTCQDDVVKLRESNPVLKQLANMPTDYKYVSGEESFKEAQRIVAQKNVSKSKEQSVCLKHISEEMIRFVHSDKTGKDYARVGVNLMLDGKESVGNILLPVDSVTDSKEKSSKYQRTKKMDVCLGEPDDRLKVSLSKNPDGTWQHKFMTACEIKKSNEEAMKVYWERRMDEYNSTVENSSSCEQQNDEFDS